MWRGVLAAGLVYSYGLPCFDGHRPATVDRALQAFRFEIDQAAAGGERMLARLDAACAGIQLRPYVDRVLAQLKQGD